MSSTPQDQSGTCSRSRSSFFSTALDDTNSTTGGRASFFSSEGKEMVRTRENEGEPDATMTTMMVCVPACVLIVFATV